MGQDYQLVKGWRLKKDFRPFIRVKQMSLVVIERKPGGLAC